MSILRNAVLLTACLLLQQMAQADENFSVIFGEKVVGHLTTTSGDGETRIVFDYKNNGRGPTMAETIRLDARGLPTSWKITGATTFGSKVDEHFEQVGDSASWTDSVGSGKLDSADHRLYIGLSASPWALGLYARALLKDIDHTLPTLPAGNIRLEEGDELSVKGKSGSEKVRSYTLSGLDLNPSYVLLDDKQAMFAFITPSFVVVREGFEGEEKRLRGIAEQLSTERFETIQKKSAHRYEAPVRIRNVRVFDPHTLAMSEPVSVIVMGRHIASVEPLDSPATPGEVLIDGAGGSLIAGLNDMHGHVSQGRALLNVVAGVTSVRDMGNDNAVLAKLIERIDDGTIAGPRITRSGFIEGKSPFSANNGILVDSQQAAIDAVRWYAARDFWQVKLYNSMNPAWSRATIAEAHRLGLRVAGHIPAFSNADAMLDAGYDELTHINQTMLGWVLKPDEDTRTLLRLTALRRLPELDLQSAKVQKTIQHIVDKKASLEPTIGIHEALLLSRDGEIPAGQVDTIDHMPIGAQRNAKKAWSDMSAPGDAEKYAGAWDKILDTLRIMHQRGILLIPGTDTGGSFTYHRELELFEKIGYSAPEVLKLATYDMARYLGRDQSLGSIEKGKLADFFLVPGDPTKDLKAIKRIRMVVKDGVVYYPSEVYPNFGIKPFADAPKVTLPTP
ncbi:MAG TPA: amidohydrolase family protein [Dokdonella sp.]|uniref:amidohydrolase family protein n=1 Tax=Dokdonella sp. TaxID=2291710 RepID=UPI002D7FE6E4|nr:amidohydrolase family protein [Dokdonella sp.]HET9032552.1 amidohydrolase family protein [Dokdonella sp.]